MTENTTRIQADMEKQVNECDAQRQFELALKYVSASEENPELALKWLRQSAENGYAEAQFTLGLFYLLNSHRRLASILMRWWVYDISDQAKTGTVDSSKLLIYCLIIQLIVNRSGRVELNTSAAIENPNAIYGFPGNASAIKNSLQIDNVPNDESAVFWLERANQQNNIEAASWLKQCYQDGINVIPSENIILMRLHEAYLTGESGFAKNEDIAFACLKEVADYSEDDVLAGEASYILAENCFEEKRYRTGLGYLRAAIQFENAQAKQRLEKAYLSFTFSEFCNRDDAKQCYQYAYNWLSERLKNDTSSIELNFALGVLLAFGKGIKQDKMGALKCFGIYVEDALDSIDGPNALKCFADIYVKIFGNNDKKLEIIDDVGLYFSSEYINNKGNQNYFVLPSLVFDFYDDINLARDFNRRLEKAKGIFHANSIQRELEWKQKYAEFEVRRTKELEEIMSMFAHKFRSPLDAIIYNTTHDNQPALYAEAAQTMRGLLDVFSIISTDEIVLKERLKQDNQGNSNLMAVFGATLDMIMLHLLSVSGSEKIQQHYMAYAKAQGLCDADVSYKIWNDDFFELEHELQNEWQQAYAHLLAESANLATRLHWLEQRFFKLELKGFDSADIHFKEHGITASFLTILLNEILVNAFKYYSSKDKQPVTLQWLERDGYQVLSCRNPSTKSERVAQKGSGRGHTFLSALARKTGSVFSKPKPQDDFVLEFAIANELLI